MLPPAGHANRLLMRGFLTLLLLIAWPLAAQEQQRFSTPGQRYRMFQASLEARAADISTNTLADIQDLPTWNRKKAEVRRELLSMLGLDPMPDKTPLHAEITGELERPKYSRSQSGFSKHARAVCYRRPVCSQACCRTNARRSLPLRPCSRLVGREGKLSAPWHLARQARLCDSPN